MRLPAFFVSLVGLSLIFSLTHRPLGCSSILGFLKSLAITIWALALVGLASRVWTEHADRQLRERNWRTRIARVDGTAVGCSCDLEVVVTTRRLFEIVCFPWCRLGG